MDILSMVLVIATMFFFTNTMIDISPLVKKQETVFYESQNDINELKTILITSNISETTDINNENDDLHKKLKKLNNFKIILPSKEETDNTIIKKIDNNLYSLPIFRINEKYYNVLVRDEYTIVNELNPIGRFDETFADYSNDKRLTESITLPK